MTRHLDAKGYEATTGIGPDLMTAAKDAVAGMVDLLCASRGMAAVDAYMLVSTCGDLRISRNRRHAELGGLVLLPARRLRMSAALPTPGAVTAPDILLAVEGLTVAARTETGLTPLVADLSFTLRRGETLAIAGESGSGKSITSLAIMGLLPQPAVRRTGGRILLAGTDLTALPRTPASGRCAATGWR